ncbi:uncharacterized protein [Diadema setosum]|uniref:uncharacterized protein n=1 Tax=Diadema setosum TaxID=31175 RepID=UPI003B3AD13D
MIEEAFLHNIYSIDYIAKKLFYGELADGKRKVGGQNKRFKDNLKLYLKDFFIDTESWEALAADRPSWRQTIAVGACRAEEHQAGRNILKARKETPPLITMKVSMLFAAVLTACFEKHLPRAHCYADDTQLYFSFRPDGNVSEREAVEVTECCLRDIRTWMATNRLLINDDKTEFLIIGKRRQLQKINIPNITIGNANIVPASHVTNLGCIFDSTLNMDQHVLMTCKAAFYHLHNIRRIHKYLDQSDRSLLTIIHAFITSRLDYCNGLLYGATATQIEKLQRVQNAAARLATGTSKFSHMQPVLRQLNWLPIRSRIHYKILLLTFKCIHGLAPSYLSDLITIRHPSRYTLRSSQGITLNHPTSKMLVTLGDKAFSSAAPKLWNQLPKTLRSQQSLVTFKKHLKTHLFR